MKRLPTRRNIQHYGLSWKIKIETRPERADMPSQKIHLVICSLNSYEREPRMLLNHYNVDLGTGGLIVQAQSRREILTDKYIALGLRPNRIKNRDLWDILWLGQANIRADSSLLRKKLGDRDRNEQDFIDLMNSRVDSLRPDSPAHKDFVKEMARFLPQSIVKETVESSDFWKYLSGRIQEEWGNLQMDLSGNNRSRDFRM
ncbi:MAG: nucleotidyl transferase AbiEii/AbiGii toxin family protein [Bacteroidales bacterium]|nr:nucleotidyl transferase AbiEii/AbiGii toxin family protein [Bacteroidales bacterium]